MRIKGLLFSAVAVIALFFGAVSAQTTEFTYQGSLRDGANAANGNYDFEFALFDALAGGAQIGSTLPKSAVAVAGGTFTVKLDFLNQFPGASRFLEIRVRPSGTATFTTLTPRQLVNSAPYSVKTLNADTASNAVNATTANNALSLGGVPANQYVTGGSGTTNTVPLWTGSTTLGNSVITQSATGDVGIGTNSPGGKLNVVAADGYGVFARVGGQPSVGQGGGVGVYGECDSCNAGLAGASSSGMGVKGLSRSNNGVFGSSIDFNGVVGESTRGRGVFGIGRDQGSIALQTSGTSFFQGDTTPLQNTTGTGILIGTSLSLGYIQAFNYATGAKILTLNNSGGNVGIGTTTPQQLLHVNGRARIGSIPSEASVASVCFNAAGDLLNCASSLRLKTNVEPFLGGLDIVQRLRPITFDWKDGSGHAIGLGAEDVAKVEPSLTFAGSNGEINGVKYDSVGVVLVNAIKEQQMQIEALHRTNASLTTRLLAIEKKVKKTLRSRGRQR